MEKKESMIRTLDLIVGYAARNSRGRVVPSGDAVPSGRSLAGTVPIAGPLSITIQPGQLICLLGPNGSGKSTLLRTLAGLQSALSGVVEIDGVPMAKLRPAALARKISLVLTDQVRSSNLSVYSLVALGRYPYSGWLGNLDDTDKAMIARAMGYAGIAGLSNRKMSTLSDGESQKVMLARALAQDTPLMMLDEPTAHLDLPSRIQLMQLLHQLARSTNKGILVSTHELDLALQVADEVWLMQTDVGIHDGGGFHQGTPEDLVLNGTFEAAFAKEGIRFDRSTGAFTMHHENKKTITLTEQGGAEGAAAFWTKRALARHGYTIVAGQPATQGIHTEGIHIIQEERRTVWSLERQGQTKRYNSIAELLNALI
jgi:iron complex transport system ATP-binding protein